MDLPNEGPEVMRAVVPSRRRNKRKPKGAEKMVRDYPYSNQPMSKKEKQLWTKIKVYFFCEEDESLHWSDIAWMLFLGTGVLTGLLVVLS